VFFIKNKVTVDRSFVNRMHNKSILGLGVHFPADFFIRFIRCDNNSGGNSGRFASFNNFKFGFFSKADVKELEFGAKIVVL
jgi:hypothetical protein